MTLELEKETEKEKYNLPDANGRFGQFGGKYAPGNLNARAGRT